MRHLEPVLGQQLSACDRSDGQALLVIVQLYTNPRWVEIPQY